MKIISVLIAAYDAQHWLQDCLDAIFSQKLPQGWKLQVLLGVDGCEQTLQRAHELNYPELSIVHIEKNHGTYITFNTLMRYATGELICRFDADDVMLPEFLFSQIPLLTSKYDITRTWSIFTDEALQPTNKVLAHEVYHPEGGLNTRPSDGQFIMKRAVINALGGFKAWRCSADTEFSKRSRIAGYQIAIVEEHLYLRRSHINSLTAHPDTNFSSALRLSMQEQIDVLEQQYLKGQLNLKISAQYAEDHVVL